MSEEVFVAKHPTGIYAFSKDKVIYHMPIDIEQLSTKDIPESFLERLKSFKIVKGEEAERLLRSKIRTFSSMSATEFNEFLSRVGILITKERMKGAIGKDKLIIQATKALDDIIRISNQLTERLREWYGLHYPELNTNNPSFVTKVAEFGRRENFPNFKESTGIDISEEDEEILKKYANSLKELNNYKDELEEYISKSMTEIAPNFSSLIDKILAARLLALAGSLEKLAKMPASTIQLLGAEKALFRHLKSQGKSPKYGIIFNASQIQNAPAEKQGKIARILASKLMLAARMDFYSKRYDPKLKQQLDEELKIFGEKR
jgi:nucleolar protein 56